MRALNLAFIGLLTAGLFLQSCSDSTTGPSGGSILGGATGSYKIVYTSKVGNNTEIALMNADGSAVRRLTNNTIDDFFPVVSPNGRTVLFQSFRNGSHGLFLVNVDGTNERMLVPSGATGSWSPDGTKIVYTDNENNNPDIWVINADGTGKQRLTTDVARDFHPSWSPDGSKISFASDREQSDEDRLYVMNANGSNQRRIGSADYSNSYLSRTNPWSPDGTRILFSGSPSGSSREQVYVVNVDGTSERKLTDFGADGAAVPTWSPDGRSIAFAGDEGSEANIFVMSPDGSAQRRVTTTGLATIQYPVWSADGSTIVFGQNGSIMAVNSDGTGVRKLSAATAEEDSEPLWSPVKMP